MLGNVHNTEEHGQKISFLKSAQNVFFRVNIHFFIPKFLLKDQKTLYTNTFYKRFPKFATFFQFLAENPAKVQIAI